MLILFDVLAIAALVWSAWPVPNQMVSISLPNTYLSAVNQQTYQFPQSRLLSWEMPAYLKSGDSHKISAHLLMDQANKESCGQDGVDPCGILDSNNENIWQNYTINVHFSFDSNNLYIQPQGNTILSLSQHDDQTFSWLIMAAKHQQAYLKSTVFLEYTSPDGITNEMIPVFGKESSFDILSVGPFSFPVLRICCGVWLLSSLFFVILKQVNYTHGKFFDA
jgi:hypothetical protein